MKIGQQAPDFTLTDLNGQRISLADLRRDSGSVLLVFLRHLG